MQPSFQTIKVYVKNEITSDQTHYRHTLLTSGRQLRNPKLENFQQKRRAI